MNGEIVILSTAVLFNAVTRALFAAAAGFSPGTGAVGMNTVGVLMRVYGDTTPVLRAGVYTEIWTGELVEVLRNGLAGSWLDSASNQSSVANNDVIRLVEVGVNPDVLVNNTTHPISMRALKDKDIAISLDKFQSKVTPITDDELCAISYDKMVRAKEGHGNVINDVKFARTTHALYAAKHAAETPMLKTTSDTDEETGRKRLIPNDFVEMKRALNKLKVPSENRRLVLCPDYASDLFLVGQSFREQYNINRNTDKVGNLYDFQVYEYGNSPVHMTAGKREAVDVAFDIEEFQCSLAFYTSRVFKATRSTKMCFSEAQKDLEYQRNKINFRHYFICMFKKADAGMMVMSGHATSELPEG